MYTVIKRRGKMNRVPCQTVEEYSVDGGKSWLSYKEFFHWKKSLINIVPLNRASACVLYGKELERVEALYGDTYSKTVQERCQQIIDYYAVPKEPPLTIWQFLKLLLSK